VGFFVFMRTMRSQILSEQINKATTIQTENGDDVSICVLGTNSNNLSIGIKIDSIINNIDLSILIDNDNIAQIHNYEFDSINAKVVERYLKNNELDYMHLINALQNHSFIIS